MISQECNSLHKFTCSTNQPTNLATNETPKPDKSPDWLRPSWDSAVGSLALHLEGN